MSISTYAGLQTAIADFLNRDDLASVIPTFIDLAEADMSRRLRHWRMESRSEFTLSAQYTSLPEDFYEPIRLSITSGDTFRLELASQAQMMQYREDAHNVSGRPRFYAITDGQIEVFPTPDSDYTLEIVYYSRILPIDDVLTSNWLLEYYPDAYLYGSLVHTAPYLGEDVRAQVWSALFEKTVAEINRDSDKAKFSGSGHRMKITAF